MTKRQQQHFFTQMCFRNFYLQMDKKSTQQLKEVSSVRFSQIGQESALSKTLLMSISIYLSIIYRNTSLNMIFLCYFFSLACNQAKKKISLGKCSILD